MTKALILGASGQDGQFLADFLIKKGYTVLGVSRTKDTYRSNPLGLLRPIQKSVDILCPEELQQTIDTFLPNEIYNLAGETSVANSFKRPRQTFEANVLGLINLMNIMTSKSKFKNIRIFQASSAEMYGSRNEILDEHSLFDPISPYAQSKVLAHEISRSYRLTHNTWISCGILFNHESELRSENFVFQRIVSSAVAYSQGRSKSITLGNLEVSRDWGYARDYVKAMWRTLQADSPDDFVISTGTKHSLRDIVSEVFGLLKIECPIEEIIKIDSSLIRQSEVKTTWGNPTKIREELGWSAETDFKTLVKIMTNFQLQISSKE